MSTKIIRMAQGKDSTLSHLYIDGIFICYLLEDAIRENKVFGRTCIPAGKYELKLNKSAGMNKIYQKRYPLMHKGMVEIEGIPNFDLVFFHIGNHVNETAGCPLSGHYWSLQNGDYLVSQSTFAYQLLYLKLIKKIQKGEVALEVVNFLPEPDLAGRKPLITSQFQSHGNV